MRDVTEIVDHYRITARSLWNTAFWTVSDLRTPEAREQFDEINLMLFDGLVLARLEQQMERAQLFRSPMPFLRVTPSSQTVPILINQRPGCWDHPVNSVDSDKVEMHFIEFFDWNQFDYVDFQYYRVKIAKLDGHPDLIGREALIERQYARVKFVEE
jgi:hypothetical protein